MTIRDIEHGDDEAIEGALRYFLTHPENRTEDLLEWRHIEVLIRQIDRLRNARAALRETGD